MHKTICWADGPGTDVGEMQIHSSGTDAAVAQQFLDREQIGSILQQMRGKCMPLRYNYDKPEKPFYTNGF